METANFCCHFGSTRKKIILVIKNRRNLSFLFMFLIRNQHHPTFQRMDFMFVPDQFSANTWFNMTHHKVVKHPFYPVLAISNDGIISLWPRCSHFTSTADEAFFEDTKWSLWWLPEVNDMCRVRALGSRAAGEKMGVPCLCGMGMGMGMAWCGLVEVMDYIWWGFI